MNCIPMRIKSLPGSWDGVRTENIQRNTCGLEYYVSPEPVHDLEGVLTSRIRDFDNDTLR